MIFNISYIIYLSSSFFRITILKYPNAKGINDDNPFDIFSKSLLIKQTIKTNKTRKEEKSSIYRKTITTFSFLEYRKFNKKNEKKLQKISKIISSISIEFI